LSSFNLFKLHRNKLDHILVSLFLLETTRDSVGGTTNEKKENIRLKY